MSLSQIYASSLVADSSGNDGLTPATALSILDANAAGGAGKVINVIADGTYSIGSSFTLAAGTATSPSIMRGFYSVLGDCSIGGAQYSRANSGTGARVTTNMPLFSFATSFSLSNAAFTIIDGINFAVDISGAGLSAASSNAVVRSCVINNINTGGGVTAVTATAAAKSAIFDCDLSTSGASGGNAVISMTTAASLLIAFNRIKGQAAGITMSTGTPTIIGNTIYRCGTNGIQTTGTTAGPQIYGNTIAFCGGDGINIVTSTTTLQNILQNIITDNTGYGINGVSAANGISAAANRLARNLAATNLATDWLTSAVGQITTAGSDYVAPASNDYRVISSSPGAGAGMNSLAIGAFSSPASGSGRIDFVPPMNPPARQFIRPNFARNR